MRHMREHARELGPGVCPACGWRTKRGYGPGYPVLCHLAKLAKEGDLLHAAWLYVLTRQKPVRKRWREAARLLWWCDGHDS